MKKLDKRGVAALEFCLICVPLFTTIFAIFDFGRYAITMQSLRMLADAGARAVMINCYTTDVVHSVSPKTCTGDPLPTTAAKQSAAPFLFEAGLAPTLAATAGSSVLTVTASQPSFTMIMPIWGTALNAPTASTTIPF